MVKQSDIIIMDDKPVSTTGVSAVKMCWTSIKLTVSQKVAKRNWNAIKSQKKYWNLTIIINNYQYHLSTTILIPTRGRPLFQFRRMGNHYFNSTRGKPLFQFRRVKNHYRISSPICRAIFSTFDTKVWEIFSQETGFGL